MAVIRMTPPHPPGEVVLEAWMGARISAPSYLGKLC